MTHDVMILYADAHRGVSADVLGKAMLIADVETYDGIAAGANMIAAHGASPRYLVIDIGKRGQDVLSELDALSEVCDMSVRVVVAGEINDVGFYRELIRRGIVEYFAYPVDIAAMQAAL